MRGGGDSTHSVPCQFPGARGYFPGAREYFPGSMGTCWMMLGVESFALVEAHGLVLSTVTIIERLPARTIDDARCNEA